MAQNSDILSDIRAGISQSERQLAALAPEYVQIEDREIPDFLKFITELSAQVNYYNFSNIPEGTWLDFFKSEVYILVALVSKYDLSTSLNKYDKLLSGITTAENDEELLNKLSEIFAFLFSEAVANIRELQSDFDKTQSGGIEDFSELINSFDTEITRLNQYREDVEILGSLVDTYFKNLPYDKTSEPRQNIFSKGSGIKERIFNALPYLTKLFNDFHAKYNHLLAVSVTYLKKNKLLARDYDPHIALLMTFLVLYQHLRHKINGITRRHLDYYYKDVLGISKVKAKPDKVNVLFELDAGLNGLTIPASEMLEALIPGKEKPELYRLEKDVVLTTARIAELKTLFISDYLHYKSRNVSEAQVFGGNNPLFNPAAYLKKLSEPVSWPLLGEDQHDLATNLRTMEDTDLGLVMGSPLFYQVEGDRSFSLKIHLKPSSFLDFKTYVENFAAATGKKTAEALLELLNSAFVIDYTAPDGWEQVNKYDVSCALDEHGDNTMEIYFRLGPTAKPMDVYQALIHQQAYSSAFPLIRLLLNNYTSHNPYTFFRQMLVERVSVKINVHGYTNLKLQNNIGALSKAHPFQPFGPQPLVGSFLNIKNTNILNRYTSDFCFHIEWLDLPRDKGGFETYYEGYGVDVPNDSFKIGLSAIQDGSFRPDPEHQQTYSLFETDRANNQLKNKTDITHVDFKKVEFLNPPRLSQENDVSETIYKEGVVRLELLSPPFAFGNRLYPQIFPEVVMNNAKRFKKKKPLPNQPYIPMVKSISVDFTLEHSENFKDKSDVPEEDLLLIHQYPFGYETIYPDNDKKNYYFMPQFDQPSNLYIGLEDVQPNQELSLLFNLEEKNFHHTLHEPDLVNWGYLDGNTWTQLDSKDVLYDTTNNFINSGIVVLKMPGEIVKGNTILNPGLFWLRASVGESEYVQPRVMAIYTNAATASRVVNDQTEAEPDFNLPANIIKGFTRNIKGLQNTWQLFPSFDGRPAETTDKYYVRVSERLRHNQRPVQIEDIIQVILEEFPQILMVKCFGADTEGHLVLPGVDLQVIVIPKEREDGRFVSQQPKVNLATLYRVKTFLTKLISPFVNVEVGNPVYEKVKVICKVRIADTKTSDYGFYIRRLNEEINNYIAPWLYGASDDLKIGSRIYKSDILLFIKQRPYVEYVTEFSVIHFFSTEDVVANELNADLLDTASANLDYVSGSTPAAVLVPSANHKITIINVPEYEDPKASGIGTFSIGEELLVAEKHRHRKATQQEEPVISGLDEIFTLTITHNLE